MLAKVTNFIRDWPSKRKALAPLAGAIVFAVTQYFGADSAVSAEVILVLSSVGVYLTPKNAAPKP